MRKTLITLMISLSFIQADTDVGGVVNSDETWTLANSPYNLIADVQIAYGATLRIEPGVVVNGNDFPIQTWGSFIPEGNEQQNVIFYNTNILSAPTSAQIYGEHYYIELNYCRVNEGTIGLGGYGSISIYNSVINNVSRYIYLWYPTTDCNFIGNVFNNSGKISVGTNDDVVVNIKNNTFYFDKTIDQYNNVPYAVENWASYSDSKTIVEYNSFLSTDKIAVGLPEGYSGAAMDAINNYWGTTDETVIQAMIFDKNDNLLNPDYIPYQPFLTAPHQDTPTLAVENSSIPHDFRITNYPNPFNPNTTISYSLPYDSNIIINIYDLLGNKIKTLINDHNVTGNHSVVWNGADDNGIYVGSGIYFYKIITETTTISNKMILMR